jgi:hypothetical protein
VGTPRWIRPSAQGAPWRRSSSSSSSRTSPGPAPIPHDAVPGARQASESTVTRARVGEKGGVKDPAVRLMMDRPRRHASVQVQVDEDEDDKLRQRRAPPCVAPTLPRSHAPYVGLIPESRQPIRRVPTGAPPHGKNVGQ